MRLGANLVNLFQPGQDERLASALGTEHERDELLAEWRERPVAEATDRIREADGRNARASLRPSCGTRAAPAA